MFIKVEVPDDTTGMAVSVYTNNSYSASKHTYSFGGETFQNMIVPSEPCAWCNHEISIIDDDFGQHLHPDFIKNCFHCGRPLGKDVE